MSTSKKSMPRPVVLRLPQYLTHIRSEMRNGVEWVSSQSMAEALGLTSSTVRQDLSHIDLTGISKRGYEARLLEASLRAKLGGEIISRVVIVGAGHLGCALALHGDFAENGFRACGIFDNNEEVIGNRVGRFVVRPMADLPKIIKDRNVDMGVIAVPSRAAQGVADELVAAGISGLLNLAYANIKAPKNISVVNARILAGLQELSYLLLEKNETNS